MSFLNDAPVFFESLWVWVPIGLVGIWRWSMWLGKRIPSFFYRPIKNDFRCSASVVTGVYQENPILFERALRSWLGNGIKQVFVVIQGSDKSCAEVAERYQETEVIYRSDPGKRMALATGIDRCSTDIVVLADSDSIWAPDVLEKIMMPFADPKVGGVGTRQNMQPAVEGAATIWERLADIFLDIRYADEVAATTRWGSAVSCLSGRTAAYRTEILKKVRDEFLNETFNGHRCDSGDDKRFTSLVLKYGFKTWTQLNAQVHSAFQPKLRGFIRQRIRWSRNTYRSDLSAMKDGWAWRHPYLAILMIDKAIAPFAQVMGLAIFSVAAFHGIWEIIAVQVAWWHLSRLLKMWPHLKRKPENLSLLSLYIIATMFTSFIKIYGLCTINKHGWLTRSDPRAEKLNESAGVPVSAGVSG